MHPFPSADEIAFLVGAEVTQVIIDPYQVQLVLSTADGQIQLVSEEGFSYLDGETSDDFVPHLGCRTQGAVRFHALLGQAVTGLTVSPAGDRLELAFGGGQRLIVRSAPGRYESGTIGNRQGLWIF